MILCPTTEFIDPEQRRREIVPTAHGSLEVWVTTSVATNTATTLQAASSTSADSSSSTTTQTPQRIAIKFPGSGGRAERGGPHPFELDRETLTEIWTVNHAGYGGSPGPATLQKFPATCEAVYQYVAERFPNTPIAVIGNSLGCCSALYLAARRKVERVFLRNPVALQQMISTRPRYAAWNFGLSRWIARAVPDELDAVANAVPSSAPLLLLRSGRDRVSPSKYQRQIFTAYAGPKSEFVIPDAEHHQPVPESELNSYRTAVKRWLGTME